MFHVLSRWLRSMKSTRPSGARKKRLPVRLGVEALEGRELLSTSVPLVASPVFLPIATLTPIVTTALSAPELLSASVSGFSLSNGFLYNNGKPIASGVTSFATFADQGGTTGVGYLTTAGNMYLLFSSGHLVWEGGGTTQLVQVTDGAGHPATAWLQNGTLYMFNCYLEEPGGDMDVIAKNVSQIATYMARTTRRTLLT